MAGYETTHYGSGSIGNDDLGVFCQPMQFTPNGNLSFRNVLGYKDAEYPVVLAACGTDFTNHESAIEIGETMFSRIGNLDHVNATFTSVLAIKVLGEQMLVCSARLIDRIGTGGVPMPYDEIFRLYRLSLNPTGNGERAYTDLLPELHAGKVSKEGQYAVWKAMTTTSEFVITLRNFLGDQKGGKVSSTREPIKEMIRNLELTRGCFLSYNPPYLSPQGEVEYQDVSNPQDDQSVQPAIVNGARDVKLQTMDKVPEAKPAKPAIQPAARTTKRPAAVIERRPQRRKNPLLVVLGVLGLLGVGYGVSNVLEPEAMSPINTAIVERAHLPEINLPLINDAIIANCTPNTKDRVGSAARQETNMGVTYGYGIRGIDGQQYGVTKVISVGDDHFVKIAQESFPLIENLPDDAEVVYFNAETCKEWPEGLEKLEE
jgi:hypothetical protein